MTGRREKAAIEENNRMGKTRDLFKQIGAINRTFHARMSTLRRGSKSTQKNHIRKVLITQITTMMWSSHLELDILECAIKWALGSIL